MAQTLIAVVLAPGLAGASLTAARRWGPRAGGICSAFPAIVGPVLLIVMLDRGSAAAAQAAGGTLLGLAVTSAFLLAYGRAASHWGWPGCLVVGLAASALTAGPVVASASEAGLIVATGLAALSLTLARAGLARQVREGVNREISTPTPGSGAGDARGVTDAPPIRLPALMMIVAGLVAAISAGAAALGPGTGGILAALPVLAAVLAVGVHRERGPSAAVVLLAGMAAGLAGLALFCLIVAAFLVELGAPLTFLGGSVLAATAQLSIAGVSEARGLARGGAARTA